MSALIATEPLGVSLQKLREMLASCDTFKEEAGGNFESAKQHVHIGTQSGTPSRPFAVLEIDQFSERLDAGGSQNQLRPEGSILVHMERDSSVQTNDSDRTIEALEFFGGVIRELNELAAADFVTGAFNESHLPTVQFRLTTVRENDSRYHRSLGRFFTAMAVVEWGDA